MKEKISDLIKMDKQIQLKEKKYKTDRKMEWISFLIIRFYSFFSSAPCIGTVGLFVPIGG